MCSTLLHWQYGTVLSEFHCTHYSWQPIWEGWGYHWVKDVVLTALSIATPCLTVFWKAVKTTEDHGDYNRHVYCSVKATHLLLYEINPQRFANIALPRIMCHYHPQNRAIKNDLWNKSIIIAFMLSIYLGGILYFCSAKRFDLWLYSNNIGCRLNVGFSTMYTGNQHSIAEPALTCIQVRAVWTDSLAPTSLHCPLLWSFLVWQCDAQMASLKITLILIQAWEAC